MSEIKTYTPAGFKALQDELDFLVNVRVEENKKEISTARAFGDLSENAEYDEARTEQARVEARIKELEDKIKLRGKDIDLTADDAYSLDEDDDESGEDGDDFDIRLLDIENDD